MQMSSAAINPIRRWLIFAGMFLAAGSFAFSAARHALAAHWAASPDPETRLRAAIIEPENADLWYQLGHYWQLDFEHSDLPLAISYYQRATSINPGSASYWMDLAGAYETAGNISQAEQAFRKAREVYPISAEAAWRLGNFLLRQGRTPEAFHHIHDAVVTDPKFTALAVSRCWHSTRDIDQILKAVLPDEADENWDAIQFFVQAREPVPAMAVWERIAAHRASFPVSEAFPLVDMLVETRHADDARIVWTQALLAAGIQEGTVPNGALVWNGGFERDFLNGGFDWRAGAIEGAEMGWDEQIVHSGRRSLRVDFDGSANVDFQNIWQYVLVQPATSYRFKAFFRTQDLSTDSGMRFEIRDVSHPGNPSRFTPNALGTQPWAEEVVEFTSGSDTKLLQVVLRRTRSEKLGNKIRGTAWIDDVALVPLSSLPGAPR
jgi:tetratricopeptide (TPR) repeat protein